MEERKKATFQGVRNMCKARALSWSAPEAVCVVGGPCIALGRFISHAGLTYSVGGHYVSKISISSLIKYGSYSHRAHKYILRTHEMIH